ncbi:DC-STAMP domain-containing protein 2-like [Pecten maximus]|uniref:DC-STAMP domain-containing protein 2-like n=1 Tax=Pecten maximus TaxID=6579 RepID=UPI0014583821|nr:DC-STAMP domain-containing protein 2-like [Pecten maximus]
MNPKIIIKAIKIKIALRRLSKAKENAIRIHMGLPPLRPWYRQCYISCISSLRQACCRVFCPCCIYDSPRSVPKTCCGRIFTDGTYENGVMRNILGLIMGISATLFLFFLMLSQLEFQPLTAGIVASAAGVIVTNGMAFSSGMRCITYLMVPQLFSSTGRYFILMYIMILVMSYPVKNFNHNITVMSNSYTCGQQMAHNQTKELVDAAVAPIAGVIESVRTVMKTLENFSRVLQKSFKVLKKAVEEIAASIARVFAWLKSIVTICNDKMGAPFRKCTSAFETAEHNCKETLGWFFDWICGIVTAFKYICHIVRIGEVLCAITSLIKNLIIDKLANPMEKAIDGVTDMFYFNISIHYSYKLNMTQSKNLSQIRDDILADVKARVGQHDDIMDAVQYVMMFSSVFVLLKAMIYRRKYLTTDKHDNMYITLKVRNIDERRCQHGSKSILPLTPKESNKYIATSSLSLVKREKKKLAKGLFMLIVNLTYTCFYIICDYNLYWLLDLLRTQLEIKTHTSVPPHLKIHVQGEGAMADMYRALVGFFDPLVAGVDVDTTPCLPNPSTPNFAIYKQIWSMFGVYLFLTIFEAYGLRLRHVIAACYYPRREQQRAVWLYNHILKCRGGFIKITRRQLKRKYLKNTETEKISIRGKLAAKYPLAGKLFRHLGWDRKSCICCGREGRQEDHDNFQHCANAGCDGLYCTLCFSELNNMCTVCMNPVDYGDFSDFSEERDSSEDEDEVARMKEISQRRRQEMERLQEEQTPSKILGTFRNQLHIDNENTSSENSTPDHRWEHYQ